MKVRISTAFESNETITIHNRPFTTPADMTRQMSRSNNNNNSENFFNTQENNNQDDDNNNSMPISTLTPKQMREMRIKELTETLLPVIKSKTKIEARNEFRKMFPVYNTIS